MAKFNIDTVEAMTMHGLKDFQRKTVERIDYLFRNGQNRVLIADEVGMGKTLIARGAIVKTAFCGPCFGAGDTPMHNGLSIRHTTRNFPNREGSKPGNGQISAVALMDARSIAATAANGGVLTAATDFEYESPTEEDLKYTYDGSVYAKRCYEGFGKADPTAELRYGPNIKDWPQMPKLQDDLLVKLCAVIHDPVTTTDELIPSGETSSYRSNPLRLSEFALSRRVPEYVGRSKAVAAVEAARRSGECADELMSVLSKVGDANELIKNTQFGSCVFANKPGDGSAREQAASCQKVLGGWANIANEYATKRYRSNLINWGMLPFLIKEGELPFKNLDYLFFPGIRSHVENKSEEITGYVVSEEGLKAFTVSLSASNIDVSSKPFSTTYLLTSLIPILCDLQVDTASFFSLTNHSKKVSSFSL